MFSYEIVLITAILSGNVDVKPFEPYKDYVIAVMLDAEAVDPRERSNNDTLEDYQRYYRNNVNKPVLLEWESDPRKRDFVGEVDAGRKFIALVRERELFPKARIIFKEGNHEERWIKYLCRKAPELLGLSEISLPAIYHLTKHKVQHIVSRRTTN